MPRKRTSKITAKRHSQEPPAVKVKAAKSETPVIAEITAPAAKVQESVVAAPTVKASVDATPVVAATPVITAGIPADPVRTAAIVSATLAIDSPDADTARDAATTLGSLGDNASVEVLVDVLINANGYFHSVVRAAAASSLGQIGDTRAVDTLLAAITDPIAEVSSESIRALAALGDERAVDALIDVVRNRAGYFLPVTRQAAIHALGKFGGERATSELREIASSAWEEPAIRKAAEEGIVVGTPTVSV